MGLLSIATGGMSTIYKWLAIGGVILGMCVGAFFYGKHLGDQASAAAISAYAAKRDQQDIDLLGTSTTIGNKIVLQTKTITKVIHDNNNQIQSEIPTLADTAVLSSGWLRLYNASASGTVPGPTSGTDATPSGVKATDALSTIADNNAICNLNAKELSGLQGFITGEQAAIAAMNKKANK
jgi:hypothetical protein